MSDTSLPEMRRKVIGKVGRTEILALDTIAHLRDEDAGRVIVTGSHGGASSGEYAASVPVAAVFFNDAGIGKDGAGIAALDLLDSLGVPAGAVAHESAVIGDAFETYSSGVVSALNASARCLGFETGMLLIDALRQIFEKGRYA